MPSRAPIARRKRVGRVSARRYGPTAHHAAIASALHARRDLVAAINDLRIASVTADEEAATYSKVTSHRKRSVALPEMSAESSLPGYRDFKYSVRSLCSAEVSPRFSWSS